MYIHIFATDNILQTFKLLKIIKKKLFVLFCGLMLSAVGKTFAAEEETCAFIVLDCGDGRRGIVEVEEDESEYEEADECVADMLDIFCGW